MNVTVPKALAAALLSVLTLILLSYTLVYFLLFKPNFTRRTTPYSKSENQAHWVQDAFEKRNADDTVWWQASDRQRLEITSRDGLQLTAYYLSHEQPKGIVLMVHGFHSLPERDFASIARVYYEKGYSLCLPFLRSHGESQGTYITFGIKERYDLLDWITELNRRFGMEHDIWIHGISMGCSTALMASGSGFPFNVRGIIADCGYTAPAEILIRELRQRKLPLPLLLLNMGDFFTRHLAGFSIYDYDTYRALAENETPVLFIHGATDTFVPPQMTLANYEICRAPKHLLIVEGASHTISFFQDEAAYSKALSDFLARYALPR